MELTLKQKEEQIQLFKDEIKYIEKLFEKILFVFIAIFVIYFSIKSATNIWRFVGHLIAFSYFSIFIFLFLYYSLLDLFGFCFYKLFYKKNQYNIIKEKIRKLETESTILKTQIKEELIRKEKEDTEKEILDFRKNYNSIFLKVKKDYYNIFNVKGISDKELENKKEKLYKSINKTRDILSQNKFANNLVFFQEELYFYREYESYLNRRLSNNSNKKNYKYTYLSSTPIKKTDSKNLIEKSPIKMSKEDYVKRLATCINNGKTSEEAVYILEKQKLVDLLREDLSEKVSWVSKDKGDGLGYDILSFTESGEEKYIEVKSSQKDNYSFYLSQKELFFLQLNSNAFIYSLLMEESKILDLIEIDYKAIQNIANLTPINYKVSFKT